MSCLVMSIETQTSNDVFFGETSDDVKQKVDLSTISSQLRFLAGRVLTVCDASFSDVEQRKAVKDLMRDCFYTTHQHMRNFADGKWEQISSVVKRGAVVGKK